MEAEPGFGGWVQLPRLASLQPVPPGPQCLPCQGARLTAERSLRTSEGKPADLAGCSQVSASHQRAARSPEDTGCSPRELSGSFEVPPGQGRLPRPGGTVTCNLLLHVGPGAPASKCITHSGPPVKGKADWQRGRRGGTAKLRRSLGVTGLQTRLSPPSFSL